ncbi:hypothetical protein Ptr902_03961 [Pyrenophora tritici-repentis]|nr:hypothetical protein Ptr902_03961 [Pyrenophora tritici-repentis]
MQFDAQLLTIPTIFSNYKPEDVPSSIKSVINYNLSFQYNDITPAHKERTRHMANHNHRSSQSQIESELWLNVPASARRSQEQDYRLEQSAYQATSHRISTHSYGSASSPRRPAIATSSDLNKPLPPSPSGSQTRSRKPTPLSGPGRHEAPTQLNQSHLRAEPYHHNQRYTTSLHLDTDSSHHHDYSRSMPSSPYDHSQFLSANPATIPRAHSSAADYSEPTQYLPYSMSSEQQSARPQQQRAVSMSPYFDTTAPLRSRTHPEPTLSPTARENMSIRPRPHTTYLSPTENFTDITQWHLFAEAMTGLPTNSEPFSPTGTPQLQGSLFARRSASDTIPIPLQNPQRSSQRLPRDNWQYYESSRTSSRAATTLNHSLPVPNPPRVAYQQWQPPLHMNAVTSELQMLGLNDAPESDDELPDYQQSQAEMEAKKRREASARARELEARWRGARG